MGVAIKRCAFRQGGFAWISGVLSYFAKSPLRAVAQLADPGTEVGYASDAFLQGLRASITTIASELYGFLSWARDRESNCHLCHSRHGVLPVCRTGFAESACPEIPFAWRGMTINLVRCAHILRLTPRSECVCARVAGRGKKGLPVPCRGKFGSLSSRMRLH